jgi:hypothetical protein
MAKRAFRLKTLAEQGPWGETKLAEFIKREFLPARKIDGTVFVIEDDWDRFLESAPLALSARRSPDPQAGSPLAA